MTYPNNSNRAREQKPDQADSTSGPKVEKIVEGKVTQRKKPFLRRLKETFIAGDVVNIKEYIIFDVVIPAIRDMFTDALIQGVDRTFHGESRPSGRRMARRTPGVTSHISYNRPSISPLRRPETREFSSRARANHNFDEIVLESFAEGEMVLERMHELIEKYGRATVAELYSMVGITPEFTDERWGWLELRNAGVSRLSSNQYLVNLPDPEPIRS